MSLDIQMSENESVSLSRKYFIQLIKFLKILNENNHSQIIEFLEIPLSIKGYGHVKEKSMDKAELDWEPNFEKIINNKTLKKLVNKILINFLCLFS